MAHHDPAAVTKLAHGATNRELLQCVDMPLSVANDEEAMGGHIRGGGSKICAKPAAQSRFDDSRILEVSDLVAVSFWDCQSQRQMLQNYRDRGWWFPTAKWDALSSFDTACQLCQKITGEQVKRKRLYLVESRAIRTATRSVTVNVYLYSMRSQCLTGRGQKWFNKKEMENQDQFVMVDTLPWDLYAITRDELADDSGNMQQPFRPAVDFSPATASDVAEADDLQIQQRCGYDAPPTLLAAFETFVEFVFPAVRMNVAMFKAAFNSPPGDLDERIFKAVTVWPPYMIFPDYLNCTLLAWRRHCSVELSDWRVRVLCRMYGHENTGQLTREEMLKMGADLWKIFEERFYQEEFLRMALDTKEQKEMESYTPKQAARILRNHPKMYNNLWRMLEIIPNAFDGISDRVQTGLDMLGDCKLAKSTEKFGDLQKPKPTKLSKCFEEAERCNSGYTVRLPIPLATPRHDSCRHCRGVEEPHWALTTAEGWNRYKVPNANCDKKTPNMPRRYQILFGDEGRGLVGVMRLLTDSRYISKRVVHINKLPEVSYSWRRHDYAKKFLEEFQTLIDEIIGEIRAENRCVQLQSPCYVIGDIAGDFQKLQNYERLFWPTGVSLTPAKVLFLGNYINRGPNSLETLAWLLCLKRLEPRRVVLLRGREDVRHMTPRGCDTLHTELDKYLTKAGGDQAFKDSFFDKVFSVLDALPLAAVVDKSVFCCHGGIPSPAALSETGTLLDLNNVGEPIRPHEMADPLAWQLLNNEHIETIHVDNVELRETMKNNEGFAEQAVGEHGSTNTIFSTLALKNFLEKHNLSFVICGKHHKQLSCKELKVWYKLISLGSLSGNRDAVVALLERESVRVIRCDLSPVGGSACPICPRDATIRCGIVPPVIGFTDDGKPAGL